MIRVELQRAQERKPRLLEPPEQAVGAAEHEVRSGERGIDGGRLQCEPNRLVRVLAILRVGPEEHAIGQSRLGPGQPRVERERLFEEADGFKVPLWIGDSPHRLRAKIERIRLGIVRARLVDALALGGRQRGRQALGDLQRHLALHRENIGELAVVLLRPARLLRDRIDQLDGHSHAAAIDANTAFHQVAGPKLSRDGGAIGVAKPIDGAPAQHAQRRDLRELTANLVGHAFREEALGPILRQVAERPHRDDRRRRGCRR